MTEYIRKHRRGTIILGLAAGLAAAAPGLYAGLVRGLELWKPGLPAFLFLLGLCGGAYFILTTLAFWIFGPRGLVSVAYYGGWTLFGILLQILLVFLQLKTSPILMIGLFVVPMVLFSGAKERWCSCFSPQEDQTSETEQALLKQILARVIAVQQDNQWLSQRIRQGVIGHFEEKLGSGQVIVINYGLFSQKRPLAHKMLRCFVVNLSFAPTEGPLPRHLIRNIQRLARRIQIRNKSCFAGALLDPASGRCTVYIYYNPRFARPVFRALEAWGTRMGAAASAITSQPDPDWNHYYKDLSADVCRYFRAYNLRFYSYQEKRRIDLTQEMSLWILLAFPEQAAAEDARQDLERNGLAPRIGPESDGGEHILVVSALTRLGLERLNLLTDRLITLLEPHHGRLIAYDLEKRFQKLFLRSRNPRAAAETQSAAPVSAGDDAS